MALHVEHSRIDLEVMTEPTTRRDDPRAPATLADREALKEKLRPIVLEILEEELESYRRSQGR